MTKQALAFVLAAAAGLAGCGIEPGRPYLNDRDTPLKPGEGMFGDATTFEIKFREPPKGNAPMTAAEAEEFKKWQESAGRGEKQEFEDWKAWQEWKKKNAK